MDRLLFQCQRIDVSAGPVAGQGGRDAQGLAIQAQPVLVGPGQALMAFFQHVPVPETPAGLLAQTTQ